MKSIFEKAVRDELIQRIEKLSDSSTASWGKMNVYQMIIHCIKTEEMYLRIKSYDRLFIGRIFGQMTLKSLVKDEKPFKQNEPTHPLFKIKDNGYISTISAKWISLIQQFENKKEEDYQDFSHPFFGKMTKTQVGHYNYKHIDHHLRQFNV
jgi:DinB superfamily